ncbi:general transcription factor II-I repeat domain-containing protein 2 [Trichonephila inaurata madagascariensis]|uniref:General transcription factor II-I repeat domain-containing protein 2 n=1 Tax=Trichonephila inaurata madagascariensis TaxID=2747483 RepID=A0A8X6J4Z9_9ARAC|nr:general transcription factor II-I repeat domain-containing protein 2 [Trichonephila inaurata madagascariensis]
MSDTVKAKSSSFESSIACDESAAIGGKAQLPVFLFVLATRIIELIPMRGLTTGQDIFHCGLELLLKYYLPLSKLNSVSTDGAPSLTKKKRLRSTLLRKN